VTGGSVRWVLPGVVVFAAAVAAVLLGSRGRDAQATGCPCSLRAVGDAFSGGPSATSAATEVGMTFHADVDGVVTGVRFLKARRNTGPHVASLWTTTGGRLASATARQETSSGWQVVEFGAPVPVEAGRTYVASYHTTTGRYMRAAGGFGSGLHRPPLRAGSGLLRRSDEPAFPGRSRATTDDYGVDVVFQPGAGGPPRPAGGPVLVVGSAGSHAASYYLEILRTEGITQFATADLEQLSPALLARHDVVLLRAPRVSAAQAATLENWVAGGGNLVVFRPPASLAHLLGIAPSGVPVREGYLRADTRSAPGAGITDRPLRLHGTAGGYRLAGATAVAGVSATPSGPTIAPGVTLRSVGRRGGQAAAFTYDLATSVIRTRQGNPAWAGQNRDGDLLTRANDLLGGNAVGRSAPWSGDLEVPAADEQQRLLVNLLQHLTLDGRPLPRFWYLPDGHRAAVVLTGDDHGHGGTAARFDFLAARSRPGCDLARWQCLRGTSYVYADTPISDDAAAAYQADGFEVALHVAAGCRDWTVASLAGSFRRELDDWRRKYRSIAGPVSNRTHCTTWSDWASQPRVERANGIRLDTTYYFYPAAWAQDRPALFTGSGLPMRFADVDGAVLDVYQAPTQVTDESGQSQPFTIDTLLDRATAPDGDPAVITANFHTDRAASAGAEAVVASAVAHGVPVISARQLLDWLDARNAASFRGTTWLDDTTLELGIDVPRRAPGLRAMLPIRPGTAVSGISRGGTLLPFTTEVVDGVTYAVFAARPGTHRVTFRAISRSSTGRAATAAQSTITTPRSTVTESTVRDFARGTAGGGTVISHVGDGELALAPVRHRRALGPPSSLRVAASLQRPGDRVGLASGDGRSALTFEALRSPAGPVVVGVRVRSGDDRWSTRLRGSWAGGSHVFQIDYGDGYAAFSIDGALLVQSPLTVGGRLAPVVTGAADRTPRWLERSPYAAAGRYTSGVLDAGASGRWVDAAWRADLPQGSALAISVRTGPTPRPGPRWSEWDQLPAADARVDGRGRYLQYRVRLGTESENRSRTPRLLSITFASQP
jgi:hypothetical protein